MEPHSCAAEISLRVVRPRNWAGTYALAEISRAVQPLIGPHSCAAIYRDVSRSFVNINIKCSATGDRFSRDAHWQRGEPGMKVRI